MDSESRIRSGLSAIGLVWYFAIWSLWILGCRTARKRYRLRPRSPLSDAPPSSVPGVSILRPLRGLDTNLYENLESTLTQEYPKYEILFSVADESDQALPIVRDLLAKYAGRISAKLIIGEEVVGINPKVNNLIRSYRQATYDIIWVLDSNVMVSPGTLARSVDALASPLAQPRRIGLVHHVPFAYANGTATGTRLEEAFLNTNHAKMYLAINSIAVDSCVVGKSNLFRRSDLERVNGSLKPIQPLPPSGSDANQSGERGLAAFGRFLAEDNMIASALWYELGQRHDLSCDVAQNVVGNMTLWDYIWRRVRWIRVRKHMALAATAVEPLTEGILLSIIGFATLRYLVGISPWVFYILHFTFWLWVDFDVYASLAGHPVPGLMRWTFLRAWMVREILALPIWVIAIVGDKVEWRGRKYKVVRHGKVRSASQSPGRGWFRPWRPKDDYQRLETTP